MNAEIDRVHRMQDAFFTGQPGTLKQFQDSLAQLQEAIGQTQSPRKDEALGYVQTIAQGLAAGPAPPEPEIPQPEPEPPQPETPREEPKAEVPPAPPRPVGPGLYADLEVPKDATLDEIKKAYRQQILKWHPDRNPGADEKELGRKVSKITEAFAILGDENRRAQYDMSGATSQQRSYEPPKPPPEPPAVKVPKPAKGKRAGLDRDLVDKVAARAKWLSDRYERINRSRWRKDDPATVQGVRSAINNMGIENMSREELNALAPELGILKWNYAKRVSNKKLIDVIKWQIYSQWASHDESEQRFWNKDWKWV